MEQLKLSVACQKEYQEALKRKQLDQNLRTMFQVLTDEIYQSDQVSLDLTFLFPILYCYDCMNMLTFILKEKTITKSPIVIAAIVKIMKLLVLKSDNQKTMMMEQLKLYQLIMEEQLNQSLPGFDQEFLLVLKNNAE